MHRKTNCLLIVMMLLVCSLRAAADEIRYVSKSGTYSNDGKSWSTAKANIQDAINDLVDNGLTGEVWVAKGTYTPTESTESTGGSTLYMSFKIPAGIKVRGGFAGTETSADQRHKVTPKAIGYFYDNYTILSGDLSSSAKFEWNYTKEQWNTSFYGNCYHVVTFATEGFDATTGRAKGNGGGYKSALLEGFVIEHGNATNTDVSGHPHNAYGGGVYMVEGAWIKDCVIRECVASRDGGGVYMDGGGYIEHCSISDCQALGIGTAFGYGGGVCMDGPDTYNNVPMIFRQGGIHGCVGRMGAAAAIKANDTDGNNKYKISMTAVFMANNTATTEAGGLYMLKGGSVTQLTIVNNKCNGAGVTVNGMTTGRSAGVYCRDNGILANSVLWGGKCSANQDIQYAGSRSGNSQSLRPYVMYVALTKSDYSDWSGVIKSNVSKLCDYNTQDDAEAAGATVSATEGYPMFYHPTPHAGYVHENQQHQFFTDLPTGMTATDQDGNAIADRKAYDLQPTSRSALNHRGLAVVDIDKYGQTPAVEVDWDITGKQFNPRPTLGAYTSSGIDIVPEVDETNKAVNLYVDPNDESGEEHTDIGSSWEKPIRFFSDALGFVSDDQALDAPLYCKDGYSVNIYVKEGTVNNANTHSYTRVRKTGFNIPSNVTIKGGYPSTNTGTSLEGRNVNAHETEITGNVQDEYDLNVLHLLIFNGTKNTTVDGLHIHYANARSPLGRDDNGFTQGGAISMTNAQNVRIVNCGIVGNTASAGSAAYIDNSTDIRFVNCVAHNNEARQVDANGNVTSNTGNFVVSAGSRVIFNHCNIMRNVGFAIDSYGTTEVYNTIFYANMSEEVEDTRGHGTSALAAVRLLGTGTYKGDHNLYDVKSAGAAFMTGLDATNEAILTFDYSDKNYPRFFNPTKNAGVSPSGDATYYGRTISYMPHNNNPVVNRAAQVDTNGNATSDHTLWGVDMIGVSRDYGGLPDIGAFENHEQIESDSEDKAYADGQRAYGTVMYVRDYNTYTYNADGTVASTTEDLSTTHADGTARDGMSWENAINGNAAYTFTYTYSKTTIPVITTLHTPTASSSITAEDATVYRIGMLDNNTPGNTVYYAKQNGDYLNPTTTYFDGDDFILLADGSTGYYYIYDKTVGKYVTYTQDTDGADVVVFTDDKTTCGTWRLLSINSADTYKTYCIQPSTTTAAESSPSWNYYGGATNNKNIGLYKGTDPNGKWQLITAVEGDLTTTTSQETKNINGLQYAVSTVESEMAKNYTQRLVVGGEKSVNGTFTTIKAYQDLPADYTQREVWVGAGIYTNTSGYEVRNHVKVYGAFPKTGTPGMNERHPQLTSGITLSKANQGLTVSDYETILQTNKSTAHNEATNVSVLSHPTECRVTTGDKSDTPQDRVVYEGAEWNGFTIRYGYKKARGGRNGGAGVSLYENVTLTNCVIRDNELYGSDDTHGRGGGLYVDGSTVINCYIMHNYGNVQSTNNGMFGGGIYMIKGTMYNSVIAGNYMSTETGAYQGSGCYFESADFFNNTVANNTGASAIGIYTASAADAHLTLYNSIIIAETTTLATRASTSTPLKFRNCFLQSTTALPSNDNYFSVDETNKIYCGSGYDADTYHPFAATYSDACTNYDYRIEQKDEHNAVNAGTQLIDIDGDGKYEITIPDQDMDYTDRVQDCEIDMGAYEYNGAYSIQPDLTSVSGQAIFYVTPEGLGNASASNPDNAACASKLQKVLDAAGRYKYANPTLRVIVKVADSKSLADDGDESTYFKYYACRTTDDNDDDVRIWSIIVPRGVEVWGGYTDEWTSSDDNGFYTKDSDGNVTDRRDITGNPTYFHSYYYNSSEKSHAYTYHVVTFTDKVFDSDGNAYCEDDYTNGSFSAKSTHTEGHAYMSMKTMTSDRAVIDGIFITGGQADAKGTGSDANINQYGGAAIVTDYAHVRNCIVRDNKATYGGALALTHGALVSGSLIDQNTADYGGAIYVFENGTVLSDGTTIATKAQTGETMDHRMAHVYTSTIVNNLANQQGGGIYFGQDDDNINVRVNSSVIWQNNSSNMANVSGLYNPTRTDNTVSSEEFFPFSYCGVQNLRLSGINNLSLGNQNKQGARFAAKGNKADDHTTTATETTDDDFNKLSDFGYYALTDYSILVRTGMPVEEYSTLVTSLGLVQNDFTNVDRFVSTSKNRSYIDIGARALDKVVKDGQLMLRLYVAQPTDIDMDAANTMMQMKLTATAGSVEEYYSQEGSSFAYPMQNLQDALDYIIEKRSTLNDASTALAEEGANNLPFEICMGRGTFYPTRSTSGIYDNSPANTFAIPEGVSIYGGFAVGHPDKENSFFGRYNKKPTDITKLTSTTPGTIGGNVESYITDDNPADTTVTLMGTYTIDQCSIDKMIPRRRSNDNNGNNIIEPWEFENQTILSGDAEGQAYSGVYHVVTLFADQNVVGMLPRQLNSHETENPIYHTMAYDDYNDKFGAGAFDFEEGQYVVLDGLQITGGEAGSYVEGSTGLPDKYSFYCGGGLLADGNRYCNDYNNWDGSTFSGTNSAGKTWGSVEEKHGSLVGTAGYRDIPVSIVNCKFTDNIGGLGGAIYSNGTLDIYKSSFEHNKATSRTETIKDADGNQRDVQYPGNGGAVVCTHQLGAYNTIFANNEAASDNTSLTPQLFQNIENAGKNLMHSGSGGAVYMGPYGFFHLVNCDIVRNQANMYPAVFTLNPNPDLTNGRHGGVGLNNTLRPTSVYYNQIINTVVWGNEVSEASAAANDGNELFKFNARLICNYMQGSQAPEDNPYVSPSFTDADHMPANQAELDGNNDKEQSDYGEVAWFSAYEEGRGTSPLNDADIRDNKYSPFIYARDLVHQAGQQKTPVEDTYQNCNVLLSSQNFDLEGPNFVNPSADPGYDGYDEAADWSPARLSNLTDNGSGQISQTVELVDEKYTAKFDTYSSDYTALPDRSIYYKGGNASGYTSEQPGDYKAEGVYTVTRVLYGYDTHRTYMPAGEQDYMTSASTGQKMYRISYDPNPTHDQTYIDIGVYEYVHTELQYTTNGDEVDILWVSPTEKPDNGLPDGSAWSQPTSDLQRAIETLLASRNGHRKEIRLMDGTFTPIYNIEDHLAFYIDTKTLNKSVTMTVKSRDDDGNVTAWNTGLGVKSLTIKGGYSEQIENVYDPENYPAVIRQQARSNDTSDRWDHLFFIADATQRYGYHNGNAEAYTEANGYGSYQEVGTTYDKTVNTIPIHLDGITVVNNQSRTGENGAAIYYADRTETTEVKPTAANVSVNTYYVDADKTIASPNNEPTLYYTRTIDKYYTDAEYKTEAAEGVVTNYATYKYETSDVNKLIISKTKVMNSGSYLDGDYSTSAVYIGKNGGNALLYNDVMHSNQGNPLVSAVPTIIVNNTYALNNGRVDLNGENTTASSLGSSSTSNGSAIFNSVFWRNNSDGLQFALPGYVSPEASGDIYSHNAATGYSTAITDYSNDEIINANYNVGLASTNEDVINGPNFTNPNVSATTSTAIEARDFSLQPSLRLLNKGADKLYNDKVTDADQNIYDLAWNTTTRTDASGQERFRYTIDLGAYEYQNNLNRIIYVNPNINMAGLGNSWADPVAYGYLQEAVDLAAVYHVNNLTEEAYVFVKGAGAGSSGLHLNETITMRNGVSVYGSILPTRTGDCPYTLGTDESGQEVRSYKQDDINAYIAELQAERNGVASPSGGKTTISGIRASESPFDATNVDIVSLVDGFDVTATNTQNPTGAATEPIINVKPTNTGGLLVLRDIIVHDNDLSATQGIDIATIDGALIYEALFRDNKVSPTGAHLRIGTTAYGVNLTVEGETVGADDDSHYNGTDSADEDHIFYSLINYTDRSATLNTLSSHNYEVSDANLNYQLTEKSQHIDQCPAKNPLEGTSWAKFINYSTDRDLLGNPRLLKSASSADMIDRGAFETWRVDQDVVCTSDDNYYPHPGSVVYIMKGNSLVMEPYATTTAEGVTTQTSGTALQPAYLLVQDGASLYGNGNQVKVGFVGVERQVSAKGQMVSLPYTMHYNGTDAATNGVGSPSYTADGVLTVSHVNGAAWKYNGVGRSAWNSLFYDTASPQWTTLTDQTTDANKGILYQPTSTLECRFTAQGDPDNMTVYVYTEDHDETYKTVELTQYDDRTSTNGAADFTEMEDMGWNCFGLPWLVSGYNTAEQETLSGDDRYNMDIPHTLWLWYDGQTRPDGTNVDGGGGFYSVDSWDTSDWHLASGEEARIWVGEGIFTQTSAVADTEELNFYRPVYTASTPSRQYEQSASLATASLAAAINARHYAGSTDDGAADQGYTISTDGRTVSVDGLSGGETITLYDAAGRIYGRSTATAGRFATTLHAPGVYIIRVGNTSHKFTVK